MKLNYKFIEELTQASGVVGYEEEIRSLMYKELKEYCDEVSFDKLGSIIFKKGKGKGPKVMIAAHIDQIGFVINHIDDRGFCYIKPMGYWDPMLLLNHEVSVTTDLGNKYTGVIGHKPLKKLKSKTEIEFSDLYIDFGVYCKTEIQLFGIEVGNIVTPISTYKPLCNKNFIATKAWDDRVGCAVISEVIRNIKDEDLNCELYLVGTVQEEVGLRGAKTSSYLINPDIGISVDIGGHGDTPGCDPYDCNLELGRGPSIAVLDAAAIGNKKLINLAKTVARDNDIPYQTDVMLNGGTDTGAMHTSQDGAFGLTLSIPSRYGHSYNCIINLDDVEHAAQLLIEMIKKITPEYLEKLNEFI